MLTDNELILLGLESEMERLAKDFEEMVSICRVENDERFTLLQKYRDKYKILETRHQSIVDMINDEVPF